MYTVIRTLFGVAVLVGVALLTRADETNLTNGQLQTKASHIVQGNVKGVYASESEADKGVTHYLVEIEVTQVLKGEGPKSQEVLHVRCWKRNEESNDPNVKNGQRRLPDVAQKVQVYLQRGKDGGYDALEPNGIGRPPGKP